jgi:hypothetical protein
VQNVVGPLAVMLVLVGSNGTVTGADVVEQPYSFVTVTVYGPGASGVTVMELVVAPLDHR